MIADATTTIACFVMISVVAERYTVSTPLLLIVVGSAASYLPIVPDFELTPTIVLVGLTIFNAVLGLRQEAKAEASTRAAKQRPGRA